MLKFSQLTAEQSESISNGCGPMVRFLRLPQFIFEARCDQHDFYYWRGGNIWNKIVADYWFYYYMLKDVGKQRHIEGKVFYFLMATIYYIMVSVFGFIFFNFGKRKTMIDINQIKS